MKLPSEDDVQRAIVEALPLRFACVVHFCGADRAANIRQRAKRKRLGSVTGWPDLVVCGAGGKCVFLEVKRPGRYPTEPQRLVHQYLRELGHSVAVVRSVADAVAACESGNMSTRTRRVGSKTGEC